MASQQLAPATGQSSNNNTGLPDFQTIFMTQFCPKTPHPLLNAALAVVVVGMGRACSQSVASVPGKLVALAARITSKGFRRVRKPAQPHAVLVPRCLYDPSYGSTLNTTYVRIMQHMAKTGVLNKGDVRLGGKHLGANTWQTVVEPAYDIKYELKWKEHVITACLQREGAGDKANGGGGAPGGSALGSNLNPKDQLHLSVHGWGSQPVLDFIKWVDVPPTEQSGQAWHQVMYTHFNDGPASQGASETWRSHRTNNEKTLDRVALGPEVGRLLRQDLDAFFASEGWYKSMGLPWKRGYLLHGPAGTGKSSLVSAISFTYKLHIYNLSLREVRDDTHLRRLFAAMPERCMVVMEDVDCASQAVLRRAPASTGSCSSTALGSPVASSVASDDTCSLESDVDESTECSKSERSVQSSSSSQSRRLRRSGASDGPAGWACNPWNSNISLSTLLNLLDGLSNTHGRIVVMTTNHPELLDPALVRPGRCDLQLQLANCCTEQFKQLHALYFGVDALDADLRVYERLSGQLSPALVSSIFMRNRNTPTLAMAELANMIAAC